MDIWKWLALAAMLYCSIAVWTPERPLHRPPPGPLAAYDFEQPAPPLFTRPQASAEVVQADGANSVLRWQYTLESPRIYILALPIRPQPGVSALNLRIRADFEGELRVGVGERDDSTYFTPVIVTDEWRVLSLPLGEMEAAEAGHDENDHLDLDQIVRFAIVDVHLGAATRKGQQVTVELDDISFD